MKKKPQWKKIIEYMQAHDGITSMEAYGAIGCTRLSGRIFDIKRKGYIIDTTRECGLNRDGVKVYYDRYRLVNINS